MGRNQHLGEGAGGVVYQPPMPGQDVVWRLFASRSLVCQRKIPRLLGPKTFQGRVSVPRMTTVVTRFSETFEGWGVQGTVLAMGAPAKIEETLQLPDFIKISYEIPVLPNGLLPRGAHYAGLPQRVRCGAVEAPDGLMA